MLEDTHGSREPPYLLELPFFFFFGSFSVSGFADWPSASCPSGADDDDAVPDCGVVSSDCGSFGVDESEVCPVVDEGLVSGDEKMGKGGESHGKNSTKREDELWREVRKDTNM